MHLKTRLLSKIDLEPYLDNIDPGLYPTEQQIDEAMRQRLYTEQITLMPITKKDEICIGDSLLIKTESNLSKFNKPRIPVTVGRGLYDATLEAALVSLHIGDTVTVHTHGASIKVTILSGQRKCSQERRVTDEMIAALGIIGVSTIGEYKEWLAEMMSEVGGYLYQKMLPQIISEAEFSPIAAEDVAWVRDMLIEKNYEDWGLTKEDEATLSEEELKKRLYGYPSIIARVDGIFGQIAYEKWIKKVLVELQILGLKFEDISDWDYETEHELYMQLLKHIENQIRVRREQND